LLKPKEFAKHARVNRQTVYNWIKRGKIYYLRYGDGYRIPVDESGANVDSSARILTEQYG